MRVTASVHALNVLMQLMICGSPSGAYASDLEAPEYDQEAHMRVPEGVRFAREVVAEIADTRRSLERISDMAQRPGYGWVRDCMYDPLRLVARSEQIAASALPNYIELTLAEDHALANLQLRLMALSLDTSRATEQQARRCAPSSGISGGCVLGIQEPAWLCRACNEDTACEILDVLDYFGAPPAVPPFRP